MNAPEVIILINSRERQVQLERLLHNLAAYLDPVFKATGLDYMVAVYAQGYNPGLLRSWKGTWPSFPLHILTDAEGVEPPQTVGEITQRAVYLLNAELEEQHVVQLADRSLVILMDDDSLFYPDMATSENLGRALLTFLKDRALAYSLKLGFSTEFALRPFVSHTCPNMPHKEKMLWVHPEVLLAAVQIPQFVELTVGEDAVIAATAWLADPNRCHSLYGIASFLHLSFEQHLSGEAPLEDRGGIALLDTSEGLHPRDIYPDLFVGERHLRYAYNGVKSEMIDQAYTGGLQGSAAFALGWGPTQESNDD